MPRPARTKTAATEIAASLRDLTIVWQPLSALQPNPSNPRTHSPRQIAKLARSLKSFGFLVPVLVDGAGRIVAGHGRVLAARQLGLERVPTIALTHLSEADLRAYALADNRLAELAGWDRELLRVELGYIGTLELDLDLTITGFETAELDLLLDPESTDPADEQVALPAPGSPVSRPGDLWLLGRHRLLCADARAAASYAALLQGETAQLVFTDPPYGCPIAGHARGLGRHKHRNFTMASGEMSEGEFTGFLATVLGHLAAHSADGAIHYVCMDWRGLHSLLSAGRRVYAELKNLCVWAKDNGGMGSLYRSQHELVAVFKVGTGPHVNNVALGKHGRYRSNLWEYPGLNSFRPGRDAALAAHPTPKPVALVADALRDCSRRGGLVVDAFAGSGTILIAAERTGRRAAALELDPAYVDGALARFQRLTGIEPKHAASGLTLSELRTLRGTPEPKSDPVPRRKEDDHG